MKKKAIDLLRSYIAEAKIEMGSTYAKKEKLRQSIQDMLSSSIALEEISSEEQLAEWWSTLDMATKALRGVPFEVWKAMAKKSR